MSKPLLAEFAECLDEGQFVDPAEVVRHVDTFLRWWSGGPLRSLTEEDIVTFLLDWCPRQADLSADAAGQMCDALMEFGLFLGKTGRLRGGRAHGRSLADIADTLKSPLCTALLDRDRGQEPKRIVVSADTLLQADAAVLISVIPHVPDDIRSVVLSMWRPTESPQHRAGRIAATITEAFDAGTRLCGLLVLDMFDTAVVEPYMRQLLDTAAAGHAAIWLLKHGLADEDTVGGFITPAITLDFLSQLLDHPDEMCQQFVEAACDPYVMLRFFTHYPAHETGAVLAALGRHLPDEHLAREARRATSEHVVWLAATKPL